MKIYYKCTACLSTIVIETEKINDHITCEVCDVEMENMGVVHGNNANKEVSTNNLCACDERCALASGPNCSCKCEGEHHGEGLIVKTKTIATKIVATPINIEKAMANKKQYETIKAEMETTLNSIPKYVMFKKGEWIGNDYWPLLNLYRQMQITLLKKTPKARHNNFEIFKTMYTGMNNGTTKT